MSLGAIDGVWRRAVGAVAGALAAAALAFAVGCGPKPAEVEPDPALWRVSDEDSVVWLFGTVHVLPEGVRWRSPRVTEAFAASDVVYFETPTDAAAAAEVARLLEANGVLAPGVRLSDRLSGEDAQRLRALAKSLDLPVEALERMRPWRAALTLSTAFLAQQGHSAEAGVERALEADAAAQGKRTAYLETAQEQIAVFDTLSPPAEIAFLTASMRQIEQESAQSERLDELWRRGESEELGALLTSMIEEAGPELARALIHDRNAAWAEEIDRVLQGEGEAFVAVGAAHMVGESGLPARLAAKGYRVGGPRSDEVFSETP